MIQSITLQQELTREDVGSYVRIPFQVPEGIQRLMMTIQVEPLAGNALDFGLDDIHGYRGWSNTRKSRLVLCEDYATKGYKKGPIMPGTWFVIIGTFEVEEACQVTIEITFKPYELTWYAGDLHMHSVHSDGDFQVHEVIRYAKEAALDYIALTDHNTFSQNREVIDQEDMVIIPGVELTTYKGHANCWGIEEPFSHFVYRNGDDEDQVMSYLEEAERAGALVSMNHPFHKDRWSWDMERYDFSFIEVMNAYDTPGNREAIWWWHEALCKGKRMVAVGGSDFHRREPRKWFGIPTTWILGDSLGRQGILRGLREGRVAIATTREAPRLSISIGHVMMGGVYSKETNTEVPVELVCTLSHSIEGVLVVYSSKGRLEEVITSKEQLVYHIPVTLDSLFYRVELYSSQREQLLTICNPIYIEQAKKESFADISC